MILALIHISSRLGYLVLAALVSGESMGIPLPGETALITAGVLAHRGEFSIVLVIVIAAVAAIVGDNIGYVIGRRGGRALLMRDIGPFAEARRKLVEHGEPFFERHGPKAVFLGRWFAGLRIAAAWLAGINRMRWTSFLFWNALGGIAWATSVGLAAYLLGATAEKLFKDVGLVGVGIVLLAACAIAIWRWTRNPGAA